MKRRRCWLLISGNDLSSTYDHSFAHYVVSNTSTGHCASYQGEKHDVSRGNWEWIDTYLRNVLWRLIVVDVVAAVVIDGGGGHEKRLEGQTELYAIDSV